MEGTTPVCGRSSLVIGDLWLVCRWRARALRSYAWPSAAMTGSRSGSIVIGHRSSLGISGRSSGAPAARRSARRLVSASASARTWWPWRSAASKAGESPCTCVPAASAISIADRSAPMSPSTPSRCAAISSPRRARWTPSLPCDSYRHPFQVPGASSMALSASCSAVGPCARMTRAHAALCSSSMCALAIATAASIAVWYMPTLRRPACASNSGPYGSARRVTPAYP